MLRLVITHGDEEQVFAVPEGEAQLGSASGNDLVVRAPGVSRRHALLRRVSVGIEVVDLGSKNGLVEQGQRVTRTTLTPGLWLQIGAAWVGVEEISGVSEESLALTAVQERWGRFVKPAWQKASGCRRADFAVEVWGVSCGQLSKRR